jgi:hypothetical protein
MKIEREIARSMLARRVALYRSKIRAEESASKVEGNLKSKVKVACRHNVSFPRSSRVRDAEGKRRSAELTTICLH